MPTVSICIPTYNQTKYLRKVLDSVFEQSFTDYEVIVSDDSTTEDVKQLVDTYTNQSQAIRYFHHNPPLGSPENWNFAIEQANGEYIKIMHHDDWFVAPDALQKFVDMLSKDNKIVFAFSGAIVEIENTKKYIHNVNEEQYRNLVYNPTILFTGNIIGSPSAVIYKNNLGFKFDSNLKWIVDLEFYYQIIKNTDPINYTKEPLVLTYGPEDRITNICVDNKTVEIFEFFYAINKNSLFDISIIRFLIQKCLKYNIHSVKDIRNAGYRGKLSLAFRLLFMLRTIKIHLSMMKNKLKNKIKNYLSRLKTIFEKQNVRIINSTLNKSTRIEDYSNVIDSNFGLNNKVGRSCYLYKVSYGDYSYNSQRCTFQNTRIGKFCSIAQDVSIGLGKHPLNKFVSTHPSFYSIHKQCGITFADKEYFDEMGKVEVGNDVWIGAGSIILDDVVIGNGAVIAANSVVINNVPPYAIVGGSPAKIIKFRFDENDILFLETFKWWDKDREWLKNNFKALHDIELLKKVHSTNP